MAGIDYSSWNDDAENDATMARLEEKYGFLEDWVSRL